MRRSSTWIEREPAALLARDAAALAPRGRALVRNQGEVSSAQDERESGLRAMLNFGHTFGHAIEAALGLR